MAAKKNLSVEEILALARGSKPSSESAPAPEQKPAEPAAAETPASEAPAAAPAAPAAKVDPKKMSTADILAMARAGSAKPAAPAAKEGGGTAPKAAPAAKAAAPAKPKADEPAEEKVVIRDNASVLVGGAAKKLGPVSKSELSPQAAEPPKPAKTKIAVPPKPTRPPIAAAAAAAAAPATRRGFFAGTLAVIFGSAMAVGMASLASTFVVWLLGVARYMFPNVLVEPPTRFKAGFPDTLSPGQVETKYIPQFGVWVVRDEYEGKPIIFALKAVCTHLGCTPNWLEGEQKFKCPCHGSGFYKDGVNFEGPAPRPLERYAISLADDGQLLVDKSRTFNQELGQWSDPNSFVPV